MIFSKPLIPQKNSTDLSKILRLFMLFFFFLFFLIYFLRIPLHNYDFWWHLATGKYIVANKSLPQNDPFAYTTLDSPSKRKETILKGNWLSEVIFYKIYSIGNEKGIIILRSLLLLSFLIFIFMNIKRQNLSDLPALILTSGVFLTAKTFPGERPQLFTFLIFSIVYYFLEDLRINRSRKAYLIPALVMALSNIHPGYVICILLITIYVAGEGGRSLFKKDYKDGIFKNLLIIWVLTIIFSMLNPNGALMLTRIFSTHGEQIKGIVEYMSPFHIYLNKISPFNYSYIAFLLFSMLSMRYLKKIGFTHMLTLSVFTAMSIFAIRYQIYYMCISAPIFARIGVNLKDEKILRNLFKSPFLREDLFNIAACILGIFLLFNSIIAFARYDFKADTFHFVPKGAADFLSSQKIQGNIFNEYGAGGYLIWRLYPDKKVFIDGRGLEPDAYKEYQVVSYARESPTASWHDIIKKYDISHIIMPPLQYHGEIYPLVEKLLESEDWALIYMDHMSMIFVRNGSQNEDIIQKFSIDKNKGLQTIIIQASSNAMTNGVNPYLLITLGKVFLTLGKLDDAEKAFNMAYEREPGNALVKAWMQKLSEQKNKGQPKQNK
jgi:hypothetical protein